MDYSIYLRPLQVSDAENNLKWNIDPVLWKDTGEQPDQYTSVDVEKDWLSFLLQKTTDQYFAICLNHSGHHIGNVEITNISGQWARCNVLIGEKDFRGKGIATKALNVVGNHAFLNLGIKNLYTKIYLGNKPALSVFKKCGFVEKELLDIDFIKLTLDNQKYRIAKFN